MPYERRREVSNLTFEWERAHGHALFLCEHGAIEHFGVSMHEQLLCSWISLCLDVILRTYVVLRSQSQIPTLPSPGGWLCGGGLLLSEALGGGVCV